jgi:hypothetical protein
MLGSLLTPSAAEAKGKRQKPDGCSYYDNSARCTEKERNAERKSFGLPTLQKIQGRNRGITSDSEVVVAMAALKQSGRLAMVFQRGRDGAPSAEILYLRPRNGGRLATMRSKITESAWNELLAKLSALDLNHYDDERLCVGGGSSTVETIDKAGKIRGRFGDTCGEQPANWFFDELGKAAIIGLPDCAALVPDGYDEAWVGSKLINCFMLAGDKVAAGHLHNLLEANNFWPSWRHDAKDVRPLFADKAEISWPGLPQFDDADDAVGFLIGGWLAPFKIETTGYVGESTDRVRVEGAVLIKNEEDKGPEYKPFGSFQSLWMADSKGKFSMHNFSVAKR